jgi:hypothetical protein
MITIEQLLESVDLDFEPRFVTKDKSGIITIWADKPSKDFASNAWIEQTEFVVIHLLKLANFENKDWTECIYEVPRKTTGKIEKLGRLNVSSTNMTINQNTVDNVVDTLNQVIDAVNKLKGAKNE